MGRRDVAFGRVQFRPEGLRAGLFCAAVFRADAAGSVVGMDVFFLKSRKVRQPGLPVGESADHRRTDEGVSRSVYAARKNARRGLTSQTAPCYNVDMKG